MDNIVDMVATVDPDVIDIGAFEEAVRMSLVKMDLNTDVIGSEDWKSAIEMLRTCASFACFTVSEHKSDEPVQPAIFAKRTNGELAICAVTQLLDPDVKRRQEIVQMIPGNLHLMDADVAVLVREAWTIVLTAPTGTDHDEFREAVGTIIPSKDDRRVSTLMFDVIMPNDQFLVSYKIIERDPRSVEKVPLSVIVVKSGGVMQADSVPDLSRKAF